MTRRVKGTLFRDYVRMLRSNKAAKWEARLAPEDMEYLRQTIDPAQWYPMSTFERFGLAILREVAKGDLQAVESWGRFSIDYLRGIHPDLIVEGSPRETVLRFQALASEFFDFQALEVLEVTESSARIRIAYGMAPVAEEAAAHQTQGFFERLVELAGGKDCYARFRSASWRKEPDTILELHWG